ncbi:hypothetical protein Pla86_49220 [Planctomycetes bacterium Pla86]|uniref:Uncharacterized protein n=1 Tax=Engelhardtia mirabilis TaxID=2528011 RepID=A0A518BS50_9BACT|nr:hypothetical protein Pla133_49240 [Planctomycetes bacterium Pla133]QDV04128.1 hypothetical protein Pla86_49220 [Planctomycetes bacterium Pla86]
MLVAILAGSVFGVLYGLGDRSAHFGDHGYLVRVVTARGESYHGLITLAIALKAWTGMTAESTLDLLAATSGGLSVGLVVVLARWRRLGTADALLLAAAFGATPVVWFFATAIEVHAPQLALTLIALAIVLATRDRGVFAWRAAGFLAGALTLIAAHPISVLGLPALAALVVPDRRARRALIAVALAASVLGFAVVALMPSGVVTDLIPVSRTETDRLQRVAIWISSMFEHGDVNGHIDLAYVLEHNALDWFWMHGLMLLPLVTALLPRAPLDPRTRAAALAAIPPYLLAPPLLRVRELGGYYALPLALALLLALDLAVSARRTRPRALHALLALALAVQALVAWQVTAGWSRIGPDAVREQAILTAVEQDPRPTCVFTPSPTCVSELLGHPLLALVDLRYASGVMRPGDADDVARRTVEGMATALVTGQRVLWDDGLDRLRGPYAPPLRRLLNAMRAQMASVGMTLGEVGDGVPAPLREVRWERPIVQPARR